jgi:hypothetical protein
VLHNRIRQLVQDVYCAAQDMLMQLMTHDMLMKLALKIDQPPIPPAETGGDNGRQLEI